MDELCKQLEEAVLCANPKQSNTVSMKSMEDAISFINNIRSNRSSWKIAFQTFLMTNSVCFGFFFDF